jgi:tetratricopeptide (TPR) repeat protein
VGAWWTRYRTGWFMSGWTWFTVGLIPVLDLVQGGQQLSSDRYAYLPAVGIFLVTAWALEWTGRRRGVPRHSAAVLGVVLVGVLTWRAGAQLPHWHDNEAAYERVLAVTQDNHRAHLNLATHLDETGRTAEALRHARRAVAIRESATGYYNLGNILLRLDHAEQARRAYEDAVRLDPGLAEAHSNLGLIAANDRDFEAAESHFRRAIALDPGLVVARYNLAQVLALLGRPEEARAELRTVLERDPGHAGARSLLADLETSR